VGDLTPKDRLQPSLLDRLTDNDPTSSVESPEQRVLSPSKLRDSVRRDLGFLLNATHLAAVCDLRAYPEVERSTLNFGIADLAGRPGSTIDRAAVTRAVRRAILDFEPRLLGPSLKVQVKVQPEHYDPNALRFDIEADLWSQPLPLRLHLRTELNLENGEARVTELTTG
jgi:type VI secretion system protein ImpF